MDLSAPAVRQLAVFVENAPGRLAEIAGIAGEAGINIRGFAVADTEDFGIVRIVVDDPEGASEVLREHGFAVHENPVLCVDVPDVPGGLATALGAFADAEVNVEYMYSAIGTHVCFAVTDLERAADSLSQRGVRLISQEELATI